MKVLIVSAWHDRHRGDERARGFPSLSAIHLAALCPPGVEVEVRHEHVRAVDPAVVDADLVAITSTTGGSGRMYALADALRARGHAVILGGPHASLCPEEALAHAEAVAVGEAERSFPRMLQDFARGTLRGLYRQEAGLPLAGLPTPRYDLLEDAFRFRCFVQATRGCPFHCTFCTLKSLDQGFRVRPIPEVVRDIEACEGRTWLQRKMVWFWTNEMPSFQATSSSITQLVAGIAGTATYRLVLSPTPSQAFATPEMVHGFVVGVTINAGGSGYVRQPNNGLWLRRITTGVNVLPEGFYEVVVKQPREFLPIVVQIEAGQSKESTFAG